MDKFLIKKKRKRETNEDQDDNASNTHLDALVCSSRIVCTEAQPNTTYRD